jgi:hypothetical protein
MSPKAPSSSPTRSHRPPLNPRCWATFIVATAKASQISKNIGKVNSAVIMLAAAPPEQGARLATFGPIESACRNNAAKQ